MKKEKLNRNDLYEEIWKESISKIAKKYNLKEEKLRLICRELKIPLPDKSYWGKYYYGKEKTIKKELPSYEGNEIYEIPDNYFINKTNENDSYLYYFSAEEKENIMNICNTINPNTKIEKYHEIVKTIQKKHSEIDKRDSSYYMDNFEKDPLVRERIYKILHLICVNLEKLGYKVKYENGLKAIILNEEVKFKIREKGEVIYVEDNSFLSYNGKRRELKPTGTLELSVIEEYSEKNHLWIHPKKAVWCDGKKVKLENMIGKFILELLYTATTIITDKKKYEEIRKKEELEYKIKQEKIEKRKQEIEKLQKLEQMALDYERANRIRKFIQYYSQKKILTEEEKEFIDWSNKKADWLDPIIKASDSILDEKII